MLCKCCNKELTELVTTYPAKYNLPERVSVTCWNKDAGCLLYGQTLPKDDYEAIAARYCEEIAVQS